MSGSSPTARGTAGGLMSVNPVIMPPERDGRRGARAPARARADTVARLAGVRLPPAARDADRDISGRRLPAGAAARAPFDVVSKVIDRDLEGVPPSARASRWRDSSRATRSSRCPSSASREPARRGRVRGVLDHCCPIAGARRNRTNDRERTRRRCVTMDFPLLRRMRPGPLDSPRRTRRFEAPTTPTPSAASRRGRALLRDCPLPRRADDPRGVWIAAQRVRGRPALGPVSVHPAEPGVLDPGRVRGAADPARAEPPGAARAGDDGLRPGRWNQRAQANAEFLARELAAARISLGRMEASSRASRASAGARTRRSSEGWTSARQTPRAPRAGARGRPRAGCPAGSRKKRRGVPRDRAPRAPRPRCATARSSVSSKSSTWSARWASSRGARPPRRGGCGRRSAARTRRCPRGS